MRSSYILRIGRHLRSADSQATGEAQVLIACERRSILVRRLKPRPCTPLVTDKNAFLERLKPMLGEGELRYRTEGGKDQTGLLARYTACACGR